MSKSALVVGAGGAVGETTALVLARAGWRVFGSMHQRRDDVAARLNAAGVAVSSDDIASSDAWAALAEGADAVVFTSNLELTAAALARSPMAPKRLVAFSSNNVAVHPEAASYRALAEAESALAARYGDLAIVRPTLIYGDPRLATLTRVLRMAHRWPLIPAPGSGRVQPVFHEDLGRLAARLADMSGAGIYAVGGPDVVTMRGLVGAARKATGGHGIVVPVPGALVRVGSLALSQEQAARADRDRVAVAQSPLPPELRPRVGLAEGLARHWAAIQADG